MLKTITLRNYPEIKRVIKAAMPNYKKRDAFVTVDTMVELQGTYWDGGSRNSYMAVNLETLSVGSAPQYDPPQFGGPKTTPRVDIPTGVAIVAGGYFCGKTSTAHIWVHPDNVAKVLTEGSGNPTLDRILS